MKSNIAVSVPSTDGACRPCAELVQLCDELSQQPSVKRARRAIGRVKRLFAEHLVDLLRRRGDFHVTHRAVFWTHGGDLSCCYVWNYGSRPPWLIRICVHNQLKVGQIYFTDDDFTLFGFHRGWEFTIAANELPQLLNWIGDRILAESHGRPIPPCPVPLEEREYWDWQRYVWSVAGWKAKEVAGW